MAGHRKYSELRAKMPREARERAERKAEAMLAALELNDLRASRGMTEEELAERLGAGQLATPERRLDIRLSTLRQVIEAMGGELRISAHFPDAEYQLEPLGRPAEVGTEGGG